jgi:hypothetical protein
MNRKDLNLGEDEVLLEHVRRTGKGFYLTFSTLVALVLLGLYAYVTQLRYGLSVTGLSRQIFWGVYITNFVFFIGISHAGTFISAVLRVAKAEWRRPQQSSALQRRSGEGRSADPQSSPPSLSFCSVWEVY